ncbi:Cell division protein kinase 1 [Gaertneriomyces sp. JEL0708]|nr:Cell division protein kinase 1 [Gaertneriomyces sp. JEL0708]
MCPQLKRYRLKLADFGMCRRLNFPLREYTPDRITFAYRPPELLYGSGLYGPEIDVWSAGCIIAELVRNASLFGEMTTSDLSVLTSIQQKLGDPKREDIRYLKKCAASAHVPVVSPTPDHPLEYHVPGLPEAGIDLLKKIFVYDVSKRLDAVEVLQHKFLDITFDENDSFLKWEQSCDKEVAASPFPVFPATSEVPGLLPTPDDSYRRPPAGVAVHENLGGLAMFTNSKPRQFTDFSDDVSGTWFFNDDGGECTYQAGR